MRMNVYEATFVESRSKAITNHPKSRPTFSASLAPRYKNSKIARPKNARRKKKTAGAFHSGCGFNWGSLRKQIRSRADIVEFLALKGSIAPPSSDRGST